MVSASSRAVTMTEMRGHARSSATAGSRDGMLRIVRRMENAPSIERARLAPATTVRAAGIICLSSLHDSYRCRARESRVEEAGSRAHHALVLRRPGTGGATLCQCDKRLVSEVSEVSEGR